MTKNQLHVLTRLCGIELFEANETRQSYGKHAHGSFAIGSIMVVFPALEAFAALCVGCVIFAQLIRLGIVPERICLECADITDRLAARLREDVAAA